MKIPAVFSLVNPAGKFSCGKFILPKMKSIFGISRQARLNPFGFKRSALRVNFASQNLDMCYAIPAKVREIKRRYAVVEYFGQQRRVRRDLLQFEVGDYVYVQAGMAIRKIPKPQAESILSTWGALFEKLKKQDEAIVSEPYSRNALSEKFAGLLDKINNGSGLSGPDYLYLLNGLNDGESAVFANTANKIRHNYLSNSCCIHGIIEISNFCRRDCLYCGIRKSNKKLTRYRMNMDEIGRAVDYAVNKRGFKVLVLQGGEDTFFTKKKVLKIIEGIRSKYGVLIFLSLGERGESDYQSFYDAGARGVLLRFETSNPAIYSRLKPDSSLENRIALIKSLRRMGYLVATGFLIGLPGEENKDIVNNIFLTKKLKPEMYSFGPLIPHKHTSLAGEEAVSLGKALRVISLARLIDKKARILVTTAFEVLGEGAKEKALCAGANSLMINATPGKYRGLYDIYPSPGLRDKSTEAQIADTLKLVYRLGRAPTDIGTN